MAGNKITVVVDSAQVVSLRRPSPTEAADIALGQFPAGTYEVEVRRRESFANDDTQSVGTASFVVSQRIDNYATNTFDPLQNNTDIWWNPSESGWGLNIVQHGLGGIFATWFNYAADGRPIWYVIPGGRWQAGSQYFAPIYRTAGPEVAQTFNPAAVTVTLVGSAVLYFDSNDYNRMYAELTVDGKTITKELRRQPF